MQFTAQQIADLIGGTVDGDKDAVVNSLSKIEEGKPGSISFLSNPAYNQYLYETNASVVIIASDFQPEKPLKKTCTLIRVASPREAFAKMLDFYSHLKNQKKGIEQPSFIHPSTEIGSDTYIGAMSSIGENCSIGNGVKIYPGCIIGDNVKIDERTVIYPGVKIYSDTKIGKDCTLHAGCVIGGDGFGFEPNSENNYKKIPHIGNVIIEDHVEIGCNTTIDRATLGSTIIRKGVKLDNLIQIAHNVEIGENTVVAGQSGIAGSTRVGKNCMIGGQVGIVGHIIIADGVKIAAQSGIGQSINKPGDIVQGSPAFSIGDYKRSYVMFRNLPELAARIKDLESLLKELKALQEK
jgi:UDP-3-O-[3-hydroxymyristoyl] glucosamine N-acyltransferase